MVDLLVVGATGFTGKLVARYLASHPDYGSFKLGLAGRCAERLNRLVSELDLVAVHTFVVDVTDDESVDSLMVVAHPRVVLTVVGPFKKLGMPLARACARSGVHYVDITGETSFVKELIEELEPIAKKTRAIMIPSSGFDSVPSDVLAYLSARTLRDSVNEYPTRKSEDNRVAESHTMLNVGEIKFTQASIASYLHFLETVPREEIARSQAPDVLSPVKCPRQRRKLVHTLPLVRPKHHGKMHLLVPANIATVQRTRGLFQRDEDFNTRNHLKDDGTGPLYSDEFAYFESWKASNIISALLASSGVVISSRLLAMVPPLRWLFRRMAPASGNGPSLQSMKTGWLEMINISISTPSRANDKPIVVESRLHGYGDPAYILTSVLVVEVALALLLPREQLPRRARQGGILTSAFALGEIIIDRLSATGKFVFESKLVETGGSWHRKDPRVYGWRTRDARRVQ